LVFQLIFNLSNLNDLKDIEPIRVIG